MKKLILLLFFSFGINYLHADCAMNGMRFFPENKEISMNSWFIIQGYAFSQKTVESFANRKVFLENEQGELILLSLQEILKGQMRLTQAIFKPISALKPSTKYYLKYADETKNESQEMFQWNSETKQSEKIFWQTTEVNSIPEINQNLKISYQKNEVILYGCGPSSNAIFKISNANNIEIWYKTEVIETSTNKKTVFYITGRENKLYVGHDMCSGAFSLYDKKGKYKVRFTPMNSDGIASKPTGWILFDGPSKTEKMFR
jgi:hypothetical protein